MRGRQASPLRSCPASCRSSTSAASPTSPSGAGLGSRLDAPTVRRTRRGPRSAPDDQRDHRCRAMPGSGRTWHSRLPFLHHEHRRGNGRDLPDSRCSGLRVIITGGAWHREPHTEQPHRSPSKGAGRADPRSRRCDGNDDPRAPVDRSRLPERSSTRPSVRPGRQQRPAQPHPTSADPARSTPTSSTPVRTSSAPTPSTRPGSPRPTTAPRCSPASSTSPGHSSPGPPLTLPAAADGRLRWVAGVLGPTNETASISPDVERSLHSGTSPSNELRRATPKRSTVWSRVAPTSCWSRRSSTRSMPRPPSSPSTSTPQNDGIDLPIMISGTITDLSGSTLSGQTTEAFWYSVRARAPDLRSA